MTKTLDRSQAIQAPPPDAAAPASASVPPGLMTSIAAVAKFARAHQHRKREGDGGIDPPIDDLAAVDAFLKEAEAARQDAVASLSPAAAMTSAAAFVKARRERELSPVEVDQLNRLDGAARKAMEGCSIPVYALRGKFSNTGFTPLGFLQVPYYSNGGGSMLLCPGEDWFVQMRDIQQRLEKGWYAPCAAKVKT